MAKELLEITDELLDTTSELLELEFLDKLLAATDLWLDDETGRGFAAALLDEMELLLDTE